MGEVHSEIIERMGPVGPEALEDRRPSIEALSEFEILRLHFILAHGGMFPDQVGSGVMLPVMIEDLPLLGGFFENHSLGQSRRSPT